MFSLFGNGAAAPQPIPPRGPMTEEELSVFRVAIGQHLRMLESGAALAEGYQARYSLEALFLLVDIQLRLLDEMKGLREDLALAKFPAPVMPHRAP